MVICSGSFEAHSSTARRYQDDQIQVQNTSWLGRKQGEAARDKTRTSLRFLPKADPVPQVSNCQQSWRPHRRHYFLGSLFKRAKPLPTLPSPSIRRAWAGQVVRLHESQDLLSVLLVSLCRKTKALPGQAVLSPYLQPTGAIVSPHRRLQRY